MLTVAKKEQMGIEWNEESVSDIQSKVPSMDTSNTISSIRSLSHDSVTSCSSRSRVLPTRLQDYVITNDNDVSDEELVNFVLFADCDPLNFVEAVQDDGWIRAMDEEIQSIEKNNTWEITYLPEGKKPIGVKWVNKTKYKLDGQVERLKAR